MGRVKGGQQRGCIIEERKKETERVGGGGGNVREARGGRRETDPEMGWGGETNRQTDWLK